MIYANWHFKNDAGHGHNSILNYDLGHFSILDLYKVIIHVRLYLFHLLNMGFGIKKKQSVNTQQRCQNLNKQRLFL